MPFLSDSSSYVTFTVRHSTSLGVRYFFVLQARPGSRQLWPMSVETSMHILDPATGKPMHVYNYLPFYDFLPFQPAFPNEALR